ncbi:MAG TPA: hypothetical protein VGH87_18460, partial [Polyangiaceae bacterium]
MRSLSLWVCLSACATAPGTTTVVAGPRDASSSAPPVSATCRTVREMRANAVELDGGGHERRALAKIAEADVACPAESGSSAALATTIRAML